jgi:hypothetical protein
VTAPEPPPRPRSTPPSSPRRGGPGAARGSAGIERSRAGPFQITHSAVTTFLSPPFGGVGALTPQCENAMQSLSNGRRGGRRAARCRTRAPGAPSGATLSAARPARVCAPAAPASSMSFASVPVEFVVRLGDERMAARAVERMLEGRPLADRALRRWGGGSPRRRRGDAGALLVQYSNPMASRWNGLPAWWAP